MCPRQCQCANWGAKHRTACKLLQKGDRAAAENVERMYVPYMEWQMRSLSQRASLTWFLSFSFS